MVNLASSELNCFCINTTQIHRAFPRHSRLTTHTWRSPYYFTQRQQSANTITSKQNPSLGRRIILLALPLALARTRLYALLHRRRNTQLAIQPSVYNANPSLSNRQLLLDRNTTKTKTQQQTTIRLRQPSSANSAHGGEYEKDNAHYTPEPLPVEYTRYADHKTICHGKIIGDCLKGDLNSDKEVLVLGDSHAAMLNHFFDYLGKELGFKARIITASSCVTIPEFNYQRIAEYAHKPCLSQIEEAKKHLDKADTIFLAASWNWHMQNQEFNQALTNFLDNEKYQAQKYIISQEPLLNRHPMRNQRFTYLGIGTKAGLDKDYLRTNQILQELAVATNKTTYLALDRLDIFKQPPIWQGHLIYYDEHHLNEVGTIEYAKQALPIISQEVINANQAVQK